MSNRRKPFGRRGMAMMMVMLAMVVGTMLAAGFLAEESTSIGMAQGEVVEANGQALARAGVGLCLSIIENNSPGWLADAPGTWVHNLALDGGTVSVTVEPANGANIAKFSYQPAAAVVVQSTAVLDGKTYTAQATVTPTGGGLVFRDGVYATSSISMTNNALIDGYNGGAYQPATAVAAPVVAANYGRFPLSPPVLTMQGSSRINGSVGVGEVAEPDQPPQTGAALLTASVALSNPSGDQPAVGWAAPSVQASSYGINVAGLGAGASGSTLSGTYTSITDSGTETLAFSGPVSTNSLTVSGTLTVASGSNAVIVVNGPTNITGSLALQSGATLTLYTNGPVTIGQVATSGTWNGQGGFWGWLLWLLGLGGNTPPPAAYVNAGGSTANVWIVGTSASSSLTVQGGSTFTGVFFGPQSPVTIGSSSTDTAQVYGAAVASTLTMQGSTGLHFDNRLQTGGVFDNAANGSWFGHYTVQWN